MTYHLFTVLKPMEVVAANVGNLFFLHETILHIPVNGRNGYTQKLCLALLLILSDFNLQTGVYEKLVDLFKYLLFNTATT